MSQAGQYRANKPGTGRTYVVDLVLGVVTWPVRIILPATVIDDMVAREWRWLRGVALVVPRAARTSDAITVGALLCSTIGMQRHGRG